MTVFHRIAVSESDGEYVVEGYRCPQTGATSPSYLARFPGSTVPAEPASFPGLGTVWSSTIVRIPSGDFPADRVLVYLDLDDGPRVLCEAPEAVGVGSRMRISDVNAKGDPVVRPAATPPASEGAA